MNQTKLSRIYHLLSSNPVVDSVQVSRYFIDNGSPNKRASEYLHQMEKLKMIEGKRRAIGETKVWRLSKKGREQFGITKPPVALTSNKVNHYIAIGDAFQELEQRGEVLRWSVELREPFRVGEKAYTYCPDAFFVIRTATGTRPYLLEVQRTPLSSTKWAEKWAVAQMFFDSPAFKRASFQIIKDRVIMPRIIVLSDQMEDTVRSGCKLHLLIDKKMPPL